jgi:hypothetical protein
MELKQITLTRNVVIVAFESNSVYLACSVRLAEQMWIGRDRTLEGSRGCNLIGICVLLFGCHFVGQTHNLRAHGDFISCVLINYYIYCQLSFSRYQSGTWLR